MRRKKKENFIDVGTKLTLHNEENNDIFHTVVQKVEKDDETVMVGALSKYGVFVKIPRGTRLLASYVSSTSGFEFVVEVIGHTQLEHLNVVAVKRIGEVKRNQKRDSFRVPVLLPVQLKVYDMFDVTQVIRTYDTTTYDISEKGAGILYDEPLEYNQFVDIHFETEEEGPFVMRCNVVRGVKDENAPTRVHRYRIGLALIEEDENLQKIIRQLVYRLQVKR